MSNSPTTTAQAGNGFVMNLGYSVVGNGWDFGAASDDDGMTISVPVAKNADGSSITGPSCDINFDDAKNVKYDLTYPAASMDKSKATLTLRARLDDPTTTVPEADGITSTRRPFAFCRRERPSSRVTFTSSHAKDPVVAAVGLAATRDFMSFLRHAEKDTSGTPNPLAGHVRYTYAFRFRSPHARSTTSWRSDSTRMRSTGACSTGCSNGRAVAAAIRLTTGSPKPAGLSGTDRTTCIPRAFFHLLISEGPSEWENRRTQRACTASNTCPKAFDGNSSNEYWVKAGSLLHTDTRGNDLPDPENVRFFLISGLSHGVGNVNSMGTCQHPLNPTSPFPALRALLVALDQWVTQVRSRPEPVRRTNGTMVQAVHRPGFQTGTVPQDALGWPTIPGVNYTGVVPRYFLDFGATLDKGIVAKYPASLAGRAAYQFSSRRSIETATRWRESAFRPSRRRSRRRRAGRCAAPDSAKTTVARPTVSTSRSRRRRRIGWRPVIRACLSKNATRITMDTLLRCRRQRKSSNSNAFCCLRTCSYASSEPAPAMCSGSHRAIRSRGLAEARHYDRARCGFVDGAYACVVSGFSRTMRGLLQGDRQ